MMVFELVLVVCLAAEPDRCRDVSRGYVEGFVVNGCSTAGMIEAAKYEAEHAGEKVRGYRCGRPMRSA